MLGIFTLGFRHGFDLDHVAAITDISGSQFGRLRAFVLSTMYALGHAAMVVVLTLGIAWAGWDIPDASRLVGLTLVVLGAYVLWCVATGRNPTSRAGLTARAMHEIRTRLRPTTVVEHEHEHGHDGRGLHQHEHDPAEGGVLRPGPHDREALAGPVEPESVTVTVGHRHRHRHRHEDIPAPYGAAGSIGVGLIHGFGAATPTQVLALAAGTASLAPFLLGLFLANSVVAVIAAVGLTERRLRVLNVGVGVFSLFVGIAYLLGTEPPFIG